MDEQILFELGEEVFDLLTLLRESAEQGVLGLHNNTRYTGSSGAFEENAWIFRDKSIYYQRIKSMTLTEDPNVWSFTNGFIEREPQLLNIIIQKGRLAGLTFDTYNQYFNISSFLPIDLTNLDEFTTISRMYIKSLVGVEFVGETYRAVGGILRDIDDNMLMAISSKGKVNLYTEFNKHTIFRDWVIGQTCSTENSYRIGWRTGNRNFKIFNIDHDIRVFKDSPRRFWYSIESNKVYYKQKEKQVEIKPGKGLQKLSKLINVPINNEDIKKEIFRLQQPDEFSLKIVEGVDIIEYYLDRKVDKNKSTGSLAKSCMRHEKCSKFLKTYINNCRLLVLYNPQSNTIIGRALLWRTNEGVQFMDRVYGDESIYNIFFDWASNNGYYRKRYQSWRDRETFVNPQGENERLRVSVNIGKKDQIEYFPYIDTFTFYTTNGVGTNESLGNGKYVKLVRLDGQLSSYDENGDVFGGSTYTHNELQEAYN
tara:strand:+ start:498 stop:1940 length:1443 start_codon:yes stop_codon:yes gene_type:complete